MWNNATTQINQVQEGHSAPIYDLCISQDGRLILTASEDKSIKVWNSSNGQLMHSLESLQYAVNAVCISPDQKLVASASSDCTVKVAAVHSVLSY